MLKLAIVFMMQKKKNHFTVVVLMLFFASLIVLADALTLVWPQAGIAGTGLWLILLAAVIILSLVQLARIVKMSWQTKSPATLLVIASLIGLVVSWSGNFKSLSGEATQEVACAIDRVLSMSDMGLHQTCLFGYPVRQYLPQVFTSIWFGRSLPSLAVGGGAYLLIGIIWFGSSLWQALGINPKGDLLTAIALASLLHFYYFNEFLFYFEQGIFPISFALLLTALGIQILVLKKYTLIGLATLAGFMAIHSYTPSLALLPLMLTGITYMFVKVPPSRLLLIWAGLLLIASFGLSLLYRNDLHIGSQTTRSYNQRLLDIKESVEHLIFANKGRPFASPFMTGLAVLFIALAMGGVFGRYTFVIGLWAGMVLFISLIAKGYNYYQADFRVQRSLLVVPALLAAAILKIKFIYARFPIRFLILVFVVFFSYGLAYSHVQINSRPIHAHTEMIRQLTFFQHAEVQPLVVTESAAQSDNLVSLHDTAQYFLPSITIRNMSANEIEYDNCARVSQSTNLLLIRASDKKCLRSLSNGQAFKISSPHLLESYVVWKPQANKP